MSWTPLAERIDTLPLILSGPIPRRTEPRAVTVWVALRAARTITLQVYQRDAAGNLQPLLAGARHTVRLGNALHVAAVTARMAPGDEPLAPSTTYYYNLFFDADEPCESAQAAQADASHSDPQTLPNLTTPGVLLGDPATAHEVERLVYPGHPLPAVVLPADELGAVRLFHGSCRKPHGTGHDALAALDLALAASADDPRQRPQQLFFTGDQIYADDVATSVLLTLIDIERALFQGNSAEALPLVDGPATTLAPTTRTAAVLDLARFTTTTPRNHCMSRGEYCGLHLLSWSSVLWPAALPTLEGIWANYPAARPPDEREAQRMMAADAAERGHIADFVRTLPQVRRSLANIATYMIFDDHDVTDDWFLDGVWCQNVLGSPLGWRIVRNGLFAYTFFQAWGNDPDAFEDEPGRSLLDAVDAWRGDEDDERATTINTRLGMPDRFAGAGELTHPAGSLRWHFTVPTPCYTAIVLDERTRRTYAAPKAPPGLLSPSAIAEQIAPSGAELTLLIAPTPVLGADLVERVQTLSSNNYAFDREAWSLDRVTYQRLLRALAPLLRVVILSGDVHYGFGASMEAWDETTEPPRTAKFVNFVSSSLKNETGGTQKAILTVAWPEIFWLLSRGRMPPLDLFAWDLYGGTPQALSEALAAIRRNMLHPWWALSHLMEATRSPNALVLPARGWPAGTFADCPPDRRYRVRYLRDVGLDAGTLAPDADSTGSANSPDAIGSLPQELASIRSAHVTPTDVVTTLDTLETLHEQRHPAEQTHREALAQRALDGLRGMVRGAEQVERGIVRRVLDVVVQHRDLWNPAWQKDLHIVGDTNLGEIRFDAQAGEAIQYLWWWRPPDAAEPSPATQYRVSLQPPPPGDAPPLPPQISPHS